MSHQPGSTVPDDPAVPPQPGGPAHGTGWGPPGHGRPGDGDATHGGPSSGSPYSAPPAAHAPKPGVIALRPLTAGEIILGAASSVRDNWRVMLGAAALIVGAYQLIGLLMGLTVLRNLSRPPVGYDASTLGQVQIDSAAVSGLLATTVLTTVGLLLLVALCTAVVGRAVLGEQPTMRQAFDRVTPHLHTLVGLAILNGLVVGVGLLLCIVPGIWFGVSLSLSVPALLLERGTVTGSMARSWNLVTGAWRRTLAIELVGLVLTYIITFAATLPVVLASGLHTAMLTNGMDSSGDVPLQIANGLAAVVAAVLTYPFLSALIALVYVDRRMRAEGLGPHLERAAGLTPATPATPGHFGQAAPWQPHDGQSPAQPHPPWAQPPPAAQPGPPPCPWQCTPLEAPPDPSTPPPPAGPPSSGRSPG